MRGAVDNKGVVKAVLPSDIEGLGIYIEKDMKDIEPEMTGGLNVSIDTPHSKTHVQRSFGISRGFDRMGLSFKQLGGFWGKQ